MQGNAHRPGLPGNGAVHTHRLVGQDDIAAIQAQPALDQDIHPPDVFHQRGDRISAVRVQPAGILQITDNPAEGLSRHKLVPAGGPVDQACQKCIIQLISNFLGHGQPVLAERPNGQTQFPAVRIGVGLFEVVDRGFGLGARRRRANHPVDIRQQIPGQAIK